MSINEELFELHPEQFMLKCSVCGKMFLPKSYTQYKNLVDKSKRFNRGFYCSDECRKAKYKTQECHCLNCNKAIKVNAYRFKRRKKCFCSRKCFNEYRRKNKNSNTGMKKNCLNCNKEFIVEASRGKFCCQKCSTEYKLKQSDNLILKGIQVSMRVLKYYLLRHHDRCMNPDCKWDWNSEEKPILELHHKDGNHLNNTLENCLLLCPNCHSLTDNYKNKHGRKSTRTYRKKYYNND